MDGHGEMANREEREKMREKGKEDVQATYPRLVDQYPPRA